MNRTPLAIIAIALFLAVGFFGLGMMSDSGSDEAISRRDPSNAFASLPAPEQRQGFADDAPEREGQERRPDGSTGDGAKRDRLSVPGRGRDTGGASVVTTERDRLGGVRADTVDRTKLLRDMAGQGHVGGDDLDTDRIPEGLRARPDLHDAGDADADAANATDPDAPPEVVDGPEGKIFDPFPADGEGARDPEENPFLIDQVEFLEDGQGVQMGDDSVLTFPTEGNVNGDAGTIRLEIEPDWDGSEESTRNILRIDEPGEWNNRVRLVKDFNHLRYMFFDNTGSEVNINVPIDSWQAGDAHEVTINWGDQRIAMYIDDELMAEQDYQGELVLDGNSRIDLGSKGGDGYSGAGARITYMTAYDRVLTPYDF